MGTMIVYRVEEAHGPNHKGPYNPELLYAVADSEHIRAREEAFSMCRAVSYGGDEETHPAPQLDRGLNRYPEHEERCGFESVEKASKWFHSGALSKLCSTGHFGFFQYEVPEEEVDVGEKQVLFDPATAVDRRPAEIPKGA